MKGCKRVALIPKRFVRRVQVRTDGKSTANRSLASTTQIFLAFFRRLSLFFVSQGFMQYIFFTEVNKQPNKNTSAQSSSSEHVPSIRQVLQCTIRGCSEPWWEEAIHNCSRAQATHFLSPCFSLVLAWGAGVEPQFSVFCLDHPSFSQCFSLLVPMALGHHHPEKAGSEHIGWQSTRHRRTLFWKEH